jgi:hypothetical protein
MEREEAARRTTEARALAVVEQELACSPSFAQWLFGEALAQVQLGLDLSGGARLARAQVGAGDPVDRILFYECGPLRVALVTAVRLSPRAREVSNADRAGAELVDARRADLAFTLLLGGGPAMDRFDCAIALGRVGAAIAARSARTQGELALRLNHAGSTLAEAELAARAAARQVDDGGAERFRVEYLALIEELAPALAPPDVAPAVLDVIEFGREALPRWPFMPEARLQQHVRRGAAGIRLSGWGAEIDGLATVMEPALRETDFMLSAAAARADGGPPDALVLASTPRLDPTRSIETQFDAARDCVLILRDLQRWYESRRAAARYWAEFSEPSRLSDRSHRVRRDIRLD